MKIIIGLVIPPCNINFRFFQYFSFITYLRIKKLSIAQTPPVAGSVGFICEDVSAGVFIYKADSL